MQIEILLFVLPALILFGLCRSTESAVTIRHSEGIQRNRTNTHFD